MRGAIFNLDEDMEAANNAECPKQGEICCPGKFVQPPPLECPSKTGENIKYVHMYVFHQYLFDRECPACSPIPDYSPPPSLTFHEICTIDNRWR